MLMPCKIKICGTTNVKDAQMAANAGADYSGIVVEVPFSERSVTIAQAAEICRRTPIPTVILTFNRPTAWVQQVVAQIQPFAVQLLGQETPDEAAKLKASLSCEIWKSLFLPANDDKVDARNLLTQMRAYIDAGVDALLFDAVDHSGGKIRFGGTGKTSDWEIARQLIQACAVPAFLSGGIRPENVKSAIERVRPYGIDLCSGVEAAKGIRDPEKLKRLMEQVRMAKVVQNAECRM
jgi:phosphoribosylanthranilate isomerase